jgi:hypothetical protein
MPSDPKVHAVFDPDTIALLASSLEGAWAQLTRAQQAQTQKSMLAVRILQAAAQGERDGARLREAALNGKAEPMATPQTAPQGITGDWMISGIVNLPSR